MSTIRERWRVVLLTILIIASGVAIFAPGIGQSAGLTNLQYGLDLAGGARLRAPVVGITAEGVNVTGQNELDIEQNISSQLNVDITDVQARPAQNTVEVFADNVTQQGLRNALQQMGLNPSTVRDGVTAETRQTIVNVLQHKVNALGLSGGSVSIAQAAAGTHFIIIEVPNRDIAEVKEVVDERGVVKIVASFPAPGNKTGTIRKTVLTQGDFASIQPPTTQQGVPVVPVTLTQSAAKDFAAAMLKYGFTTGRGIENCQYQSAPNSSYCILTVLNGEVVYAAGMGGNLAQDIRTGNFNQTGKFVIQTRNMSEARQLQINLQAGALPASLDLENGTANYISSSRAENFKVTTFITALVAVFAVSGVVFLRYGRREVALPMIVTALSEVIILLGFAAAIRLPLTLSHIAGFIAVIGTGVDDLIIIADEVLTEEVSSSHVFKNRFRKALWIIGAAAATTIIAMAPLTQLSLGDLRGFAIITILGVLIGVIITRPAYGDILRELMTDK
ncbi:MAG: preprotein translocase subunit SecD [Halobacteriaceae archaeon]